MRKPTDNCLLCKQNLSSKENSHILTRFISTSFIKAGGAKKGNSLSSDSVLKTENDAVILAEVEYIQDSPKQDYILCHECENYLGIVEGLSRDTFISWREQVDQSKFNLVHTNTPLDIVECVSSNPRVIRLFVYSLFWRASISDHKMFDGYKLSDFIEEDLRQILFKYKAQYKRDFLENVNAAPYFNDYPYSALTTIEFNDDTICSLFAPTTNDPYSLIVDRFIFMLYPDKKHREDTPLKEISNKEHQDCFLVVLPQDSWQELNRIPILHLLAVAQSKL